MKIPDKHNNRCNLENVNKHYYLLLNYEIRLLLILSRIYFLLFFLVYCQVIHNELFKAGKDSNNSNNFIYGEVCQYLREVIQIYKKGFPESICPSRSSYANIIKTIRQKVMCETQN